LFTQIPLFIVVTGDTTWSSISDVRTMFMTNPSALGCASGNTLAQGCTGGTSQAAAFNNIVGLGGQATGPLGTSVSGSFSAITQSNCANTGYVNGANVVSSGTFPGLPVVFATCGGVIMPSNDPTAITGGSSTSTTITVNVASLPAAFQVIGTPIVVSGALPAGFNTPVPTTPPSTLATIVSFTSTSVTYSSTNNPGAWTSGGTLALATAIQSNGLTGFVDDYVSGGNATGGALGLAGAFQARAFAPNGAVFGANIVSQAETGAAGTSVTGLEIDVDTQVPSPSISALTIDSVWNSQPTTSNGVVVLAPGGTGNAQYSRVFVSGNGASTIGVQLGTADALNVSGPSPSQSIQFLSGTPGVDTPIASINADVNGNLILTSVAGQNVESVGPLTAPSAKVSGVVTGANVRSTDGSSASLTMNSIRGQNFLLSENSALSAAATLEIVGPSAGAIPEFLVNATTTEVTGGLNNSIGTVIPSTATGFVGSAIGAMQLVLQGTTGTITGTHLSASCDSGTATVTGVTVGHPVAVSSTTGADVGGAFNVRASVTGANTVTVFVCGTGTPPSLAYNVTVF
jgi:hypothetical protein